MINEILHTAHWFFIITIGLCVATSQASVYTIDENQKLIGEPKTVYATYNDTFISIAKEFDLGYEELVAANPGIDPWLVKEGTKINLPSQFILPPSRAGIHINLAEYRLYYFDEDNAKQVWSFPVSIGRGDWQTPKGQVVITDKIINPSWYPPESIRKEHALNGDPLPYVVLPGPDNPLGKYALKLSAKGYFIHGTNRPYGIGMQVTHGCVRLRPPDIQVLFQKILRKNKVYISYEPFKFTIEDTKIYFEAHPRHSASKEENSQKWMKAMADLLDLANSKHQLIDRKKLSQINTLREGMPRVVNLMRSTEPIQVMQAPRFPPSKRDPVTDASEEQLIF